MKKILTLLIYAIFLLFPQIAQCQSSDIKAFLNGRTEKFFTKDHPKAKGINISLEYPKSWVAKEGERPNIVQKFSRAFKDGSSIMCLILIKDLPSQVKIFSDEDIAKEIFSEEVIKSMFPNNSKLLEHRQTKYDGQPGALSSFVMVQERSGIQLFSYVLQHAFIYSEKMISIQCTVGGLSANSKEIDELYKNYAPLFIQIGNSIVIHDKWNKDTVSGESSAMGIAFGEYWWITLIISALLTWGVGLLLPILIRYVFVRRPISKKVALIIVGILWCINIVLFTALGSQSRAHIALFLVAWVSYLILHKGYKSIK